MLGDILHIFVEMLVKNDIKCNAYSVEPVMAGVWIDT